MWICPTCGEKNYDDPECRQCHVAQPGSLLALGRRALAPSGSDEGADDAGADDDDERAAASEPRNRRPGFKVKANLRELGLDRRRPADESEEEGADDDDDATDEDEDVGAVPARRPSIPQLLVIAVAVILVVLSVVGFGRWAGS